MSNASLHRQAWGVTGLVTVLCGVFITLPSLAVAGWPSIPLPPNSQGELISGHMLNMGLEMQASTFVSSQPKSAVVAFYRALWGDEMIETEAGAKTILAYATDAHLTSIELSSTGEGTEGRIGITRKPDQNAEFTPGQGVILPAGTTVQSDVRFLDLDNKPRVLTTTNTHSPYVNLQFYRQQLVPKGWTATEMDTHCVAHADRCGIEFENPRAGRIVLYASREGSHGPTHLVLHID